ncbi:MAG: GDP-mannose 4,6-dehydratase [Candidatus Hodarchaeota archaeon]
MKILITGAGGFIGSHLVDFCLSKGHEVLATVEPGKKLFNLEHLLKDGKPYIPSFEYKFVDVRDAKKIDGIIGEMQPDGIFHMAAQSYVKPSWEDPATTFDTNIVGTVNIFEPVKKHELSTKIIVACSSAEYGTITKEDVPIKETLPLQPLHPYGISKVGQDLLARQYFLNFGIETIRLRYFNQTGIRKTGDACADFSMKIAEIETGKVKPIIKVGNLETFRDIQDIRDCVQANWMAFEKGKSGEVYNVCTGIATKIRDVLNGLLKLSSKDIQVVEKNPEKMRYQDEPIILGDNSRIKKELGYKPGYKIQQTIKDMFEYWRDVYSNEGKPSRLNSYYPVPT